MQRKIIWMLFLFIGISVISNSCVRRISLIHTVNYIYKNKTGFDLVMEVYDIEGVNLKNFPIAYNEEVETGTTREEGPVPFLFYEPPYNVTEYGYTVIIRFSNNRCLSYSRKNGAGIYGDKIFDYREYDNYTPGLVEQEKYTLYYTITVDDYNESVDCE